MKCVPIPNQLDLMNAHDQLVWNKGQKVTESDLILWSHWSRINARLAETLVKYLVQHFRKFNPFILFEANLQSPLPQALAVLIEFAKLDLKQKASDRSTSDHNAFKLWSQIITQNLDRASPQMFFVNDGIPNSNRDWKEISRSLTPYKRWGFFGVDFLPNEKGLNFKNKTLLGPQERMSALSNLLANQSKITVADYITACGKKVHRRTAERDLESCNRLTKKGHTRKRIYYVK